MVKFFDETFNGNFLERVRREIEEIEKAIRSEKQEGNWKVTHFNEPGVKGYVIRGRFGISQPFEPSDPFDPLEPWRRRPMPQRPFMVSNRAIEEEREPLTDIFEEENALKIYVELFGEKRENVLLNIVEGKVEVKAENYYRLIDLPKSDLNIEKASSRYKNGVLEITIPKKKKQVEELNITIE